MLRKLVGTSDIYNYANDNTIGAAAKDLDGLQHVLKR